MMTKENTGRARVLVALDGTEDSLGVVQYVTKAIPHMNTDIVLFHVMSKVPEVFWDLGNDPAWQQKIESIKQWEREQELTAISFMKTANELFLAAGFPDQSVTSRIGIQEMGIARDIVAEAKRGYDLLIIGRGKSGVLEDGPLGSVASKISSTSITYSLSMVGGNASAENVLIAIDSSDNAMRAVDYAGRMFNRGKNRFTLFHAIRGIPVTSLGMEEIFPEFYRKRLLEDAERDIKPAMKLAELRLAKFDISPERITSKIVTGVTSRAATIIDEVKSSNYGTIVVGRRGLSQVAEFSMGRVTNKLIQLSRDQALTIVS